MKTHIRSSAVCLVILNLFTNFAVAFDSDKHLLFSGSANPELAEKIANELNIKLSPLTVRQFADKEYFPKYDRTISNKHVYIIQSTCTANPGSVNDHYMELFLEIYAAKFAGAKKITAVIPYFGYARQDRKTQPRVAISAALMARFLEEAGANRVITIDIHADQEVGFFREAGVHNLTGSMIFAPEISLLNLKDIIVVSPDAGGTNRARKFAEYLINSNVPVESVVTIIKTRSPTGELLSTNLSGNVQGKVAIIYDDMVDSGGTLVKAAEELLTKGAVAVYACITHPVLSGNALEKIEKSPFKLVMVTDTIPLRGTPPKNLKVISAAPIIAKTIERVSKGQSVSELFETTGNK